VFTHSWYTNRKRQQLCPRFELAWIVSAVRGREMHAFAWNRSDLERLMVVLSTHVSFLQLWWSLIYVASKSSCLSHGKAGKRLGKREKTTVCDQVAVLASCLKQRGWSHLTANEIVQESIKCVYLAGRSHGNGVIW